MLDSVKLLSAWKEMPSLATFSHGEYCVRLRHSGVAIKTLPKCIICMNCWFQWIYLCTFDFSLWNIPLENEKRLILVWFSSNEHRCRLGSNQMTFFGVQLRLILNNIPKNRIVIKWVFRLKMMWSQQSNHYGAIFSTLYTHWLMSK